MPSLVRLLSPNLSPNRVLPPFVVQQATLARAGGFEGQALDRARVVLKGKHWAAPRARVWRPSGWPGGASIPSGRGSAVWGSLGAHRREIRTGGYVLFLPVSRRCMRRPPYSVPNPMPGIYPAPGAGSELKASLAQSSGVRRRASKSSGVRCGQGAGARVPAPLAGVSRSGGRVEWFRATRRF
jgi:hypothetical protein